MWFGAVLWWEVIDISIECKVAIDILKKVHNPFIEGSAEAWAFNIVVNTYEISEVKDYEEK